MHGLKDVNLESEIQRLSNASSSSSSSSRLRNLSKEGLKLPLEPFTRSNLVRVAPLTSTVVVRVRATEAKVIERATQEESSTTGSEEAMTHKNGYDLDHYVSTVTQTQLEALRVCFNIPLAIIIRAHAQGELP